MSFGFTPVYGSNRVTISKFSQPQKDAAPKTGVFTMGLVVFTIKINSNVLLSSR